MLSLDAMSDLLDGEGFFAGVFAVEKGSRNPYGVGGGEVDLESGFHEYNNIT
jgi:hypothetical protein